MESPHRLRVRIIGTGIDAITLHGAVDEILSQQGAAVGGGRASHIGAVGLTVYWAVLTARSVGIRGGLNLGRGVAVDGFCDFCLLLRRFLLVLSFRRGAAWGFA
jgi:hypothetical protein